MINAESIKSIFSYTDSETRPNKYYSVFVILIISLLGTNFLLYGFFPFFILKNIVRLLTVAVILFYICTANREYSFRELVCVIISLYLLLLGGNMTLNISFIILTSICMSDCKDIEKICFICSAFLAAVVTISLITHIVQANVYVQGDRIRNTLGFYNVNAGSIFIFSVLILFLYSRKNISIIHIVISLIISTVIYHVTNSRTAFLGLVIFCTIYEIITKCNMLAYLIIVLDVLCLLSPLLWLIPQFNDLEFDKLLSGRPHVFIDYIHSNTTMNFIIGGSNVKEVDNFYLMLFYNVGVILYVIFAIITLYSMIYYKDNKDYKSISYVSSILFIGLMESGALRCEIICMLVFWMLILKPFISSNNHIEEINSQINEDI